LSSTIEQPTENKDDSLSHLISSDKDHIINSQQNQQEHQSSNLNLLNQRRNMAFGVKSSPIQTSTSRKTPLKSLLPSQQGRFNNRKIFNAASPSSSAIPSAKISPAIMRGREARFNSRRQTSIRVRGGEKNNSATIKNDTGIKGFGGRFKKGMAINNNAENIKNTTLKRDHVANGVGIRKSEAMGGIDGVKGRSHHHSEPRTTTTKSSVMSNKLTSGISQTSTVSALGKMKSGFDAARGTPHHSVFSTKKSVGVVSNKLETGTTQTTKVSVISISSTTTTSTAKMKKAL